MKTAKRLITLVLTLAMALTMAFSAFAVNASDGTITIRDSESGEKVASRTFDIYKIFNATTSGSAISYQWYIPDGETESPYYDFFYTDWNSSGTMLLDPADGKGDSQERAAQYMRQLTADDLIVLSIDLYEYIDVKGISATETKTAAASDVNVQFTGLEYGYYLVYDATATPEMRAAVILTSVAPTSVVNLKADKPTISKVFNGSKKTGSAVIGDVVKYEVSSVVPDHQFFTSSYTYSITDEVPDALTLDAASITVKKADVELTPDVDYTLNVVGQDITVDFLKVLDWTKGEKLVIAYEAQVNDLATPDAHIVNTATLTYSNDPSDLSSTGTAQSMTDIHVYYIELTKVADENYKTVLEGAKFKFYRISEGVRVPLNLVEVSDGYYRVEVIPAGSTASDIELDTFEGILKIEGIGAGVYEIVETVAPDGYKLPLDGFEFTVTETFATDGSSTLDGMSMDNITTTNTFGKIIEQTGHVDATSGGSDIGYVTFKLTNQAGTALPETGGMGTTLFTFGGVLLMAVALGFFTSRKRSNA